MPINGSSCSRVNPSSDQNNFKASYTSAVLCSTSNQWKSPLPFKVTPTIFGNTRSNIGPVSLYEPIAARVPKVEPGKNRLSESFKRVKSGGITNEGTLLLD